MLGASELSIDASSHDDLESLGSLYTELVERHESSAHLHPPTRGELEEWLFGARVASCRVARVAGQIVGFALVSRLSPWAAWNYTYEVGVFVAPPMRRQGYGRRLWEAARAEARRSSIRTLMALVRREVEPLGGELEKIGFVDCGWIAEIGGRRDDVIDMRVLQYDCTEGDAHERA